MKHAILLYKRLLIMVLIFAFILSGCSSDHDEDLNTGVFVDSNVQGLKFECGNRVGRTDKDGEFYYKTGDSVEFSIGGVYIGDQVEAQEIITPMTIVPGAFITHRKVTNICRFLQSLDEDENPDNGITISAATRDIIRQEITDKGLTIDFDQPAGIPDNFGNPTTDDFGNDAGVQSIFNRLGRELLDYSAAQKHFFQYLAETKTLAVDLIAIGDGMTAGVQSGNGNLNSYTQTDGYAKKIADFLISSTGLSDWHVPLLKLGLNDNEDRILMRSDLEALSAWQETEEDEENPYIPYNLGVPGSTLNDIINEKTGSGNELLDKIIWPIPNPDYYTALAKENETLEGYPLTEDSKTQLEAAKWLANQDGHETRMKLFIISSCIHDVLGTSIEGNGDNLTLAAINAYRDLLSEDDYIQSIKDNLKTIIDELAAVHYSYIFIATLPDFTRMAGFLDEEDIESLAAFEGADITPKEEEYYYIGLIPFKDSVASALKPDSTNADLNSAVTSVLSVDGNFMNTEESNLIKNRVNEINAYINSLSATYPTLFVVDVGDLYDKLNDGTLQVFAEGDAEDSEDDKYYTLSRKYGGGFYSMDGIYPSHTGYAEITKKFLEKLSDPFDNFENELTPEDDNYDLAPGDDGYLLGGETGMYIRTKDIDAFIEYTWSSDPYRDYDGDGFPTGPGSVAVIIGEMSDIVTIFDPVFESLVDCDDRYDEDAGINRSDILPECVTGVACDEL